MTYRTANPQSCILYIYSTNIGTEYFKHGIYSPFFSSSKCSLFHNSNLFGSVLFTLYVQGVLKLKKIIPAPKGITSVCSKEHYSWCCSLCNTVPQLVPPSLPYLTHSPQHPVLSHTHSGQCHCSGGWSLTSGFNPGPVRVEFVTLDKFISQTSVFLVSIIPPTIHTRSLTITATIQYSHYMTPAPRAFHPPISSKCRTKCNRNPLLAKLSFTSGNSFCRPCSGNVSVVLPDDGPLRAETCRSDRVASIINVRIGRLFVWHAASWQARPTNLTEDITMCYGYIKTLINIRPSTTILCAQGYTFRPF